MNPKMIEVNKKKETPSEIYDKGWEGGYKTGIRDGFPCENDLELKVLKAVLEGVGQDFAKTVKKESKENYQKMKKKLDALRAIYVKLSKVDASLVFKK